VIVEPKVHIHYASVDFIDVVLIYRENMAELLVVDIVELVVRLGEEFSNMVLVGELEGQLHDSIIINGQRNL
jgi:hypothetical protein